MACFTIMKTEEISTKQFVFEIYKTDEKTLNLRRHYYLYYHENKLDCLRNHSYITNTYHGAVLFGNENLYTTDLLKTFQTRKP